MPSLVHEGLDLESVELTDAALQEADAVLIVTDHTEVDYARVVEQARLVVDTRNVSGGFLPSASRSEPQAQSSTPSNSSGTP